ncbi:MAG: aromatic ring-hydroxylating dioxygenase subunit alpha, partial [Actinobacteria bacterium]|nr:aromatic ring-hydroxylating dioxygenase subunit alpha [Actinomycetota bacterium]
KIFRGAWQYAGHTGQLGEGAGFFATRAGRTPVVVTRDSDGILRAFVNVCRHRGSVIAEGEGARETLQCPYHAWTYGLDGKLLAAPRSGEEPDFPRDELGLKPVAVDTWGPFVFVNAGAEPEPLTDALGSLPAQVAELLDVDALVHHSRWEAEVAANWKIVCENFLECYHCQVAHPAFAEVIDTSVEAYRLSTDGRLSSQRGPVRANVELDGELQRSQFHFLWPNLGVNIFAGHANLSIGPMIPLSSDRTYRFLDYFFGSDVDPAWIDDLMAFDTQVGDEDRGLVEGVHRGMASGALDGGVLMAHSEQLISHFQGLTAAALQL